MGKFLDSEKIRQAAFKTDSPYFSGTARGEGIYKSKPRPFCLPRELAEENLYPAIRQSACDYFAAQGIKWHDGQDGRPSNHLCDSQVCCVNFLFPFVDKPHGLAALLRPFFPKLREVLPIENGQYVAFEWIGQENYLGEKRPRNSSRTRGANYTSTDAAVKFLSTDGLRQIVLIEWKYTESYGGTSLAVAQSGTDRREIYRHLFEAVDVPLDTALLPCYDALFYEPFYQLMRQQFLAHEMEKAQELGADIVSVLHIAPAQNTDFRNVTSRALQSLAGTPTDIWKKLVRPSDRFMSTTTEALFRYFPIERFPALSAWHEYMQKRYAWLQDASS